MELRTQYLVALLDLELLNRPRDEIDVIGRKAIALGEELVERLTPYAERALAGKGRGDDMISMYAEDGPGIFPDWGMDDMMAGILTAFFAGSDTTATAVTNGIYLLLTRPGLQDELLVAGEDAFAVFVEEALRILGVSHLRTLNVVQDAEIGGVEVRKGSTVVPVQGAANVDPQHYECPFDVKLDRKNPRDHTTFWMGARACGGMWLARAELLEIYTGLLDRLVDLRLDPEAEQPRVHGWAIRSYRPLHVLFQAV
jgi:cytochrome P450